jgi:SAM-dependent methyltransferase
MKLREKSRFLKEATKQSRRRFRQSFRDYLAPVDYTRQVEIPALLEVISRENSGKMSTLDIASPQVLSCFLASQNSENKITYLNSFKPELDQMRVRRGSGELDNIDEVLLDARDASCFGANTFDLVVSCSVLEHVTSMAGSDGDALICQNVAKWLKPGGLFVLSVPFHTTGFSEYRDKPVYQDQERSKEGYFFQRFYDSESFEKRLVESNELSVERKIYVGEKHYFPNDIYKRFAFLVGVGWRKLFLGKALPVLSSIFMEVSEKVEHLRKPYLVVVCLKKEVK